MSGVVRLFASCVILATVASACSDSSPTSPAPTSPAPITVPSLASVLIAGPYTLDLRVSSVVSGTLPGVFCASVNGSAPGNASVPIVLLPAGSEWVARAENGTLQMSIRPSYETNTVSGTMDGTAQSAAGASAVVVSGRPAGDHGQLTGSVGTDGRVGGEFDGSVSYQSPIGSYWCSSVTDWRLIPR